MEVGVDQQTVKPQEVDVDSLVNALKSNPDLCRN